MTVYGLQSNYSKCPKISHIKVSDIIEYANSADPDHSGSTLFAISVGILRKKTALNAKFSQKKYGVKCSKF